MEWLLGGLLAVGLLFLVSYAGRKDDEDAGTRRDA